MLMADGAASALPAASAPANGPEGEDLDWASIDWRRVEEDVRRLRQRIFTASQAGDLKKVRNLQKLMLRSRSNTGLAQVPESPNWREDAASWGGRQSGHGIRDHS
ncbi:reverse transcriptase N-terminal domain-containing protein, partial [Streptomyces sp. NPDC051644]|uniref:reverse transcriptase N-terminal domain-containing protein n=1 Tax=Streptomyces sp. NPDC051644 TaxID=3365666 RepID=UPI0037B6287F